MVMLALKIIFIDGDETISDDESLIYYAKALQNKKADPVVRANHESCLRSQIKTAYEMSAKSWELVQYQPVMQKKPSLISRLVRGVA